MPPKLELIKTDTLRMRCPCCQKLYSLSADTMRAAIDTPKFHCVSCKTNFGAMISLANGFESVETFEITEPRAPESQVRSAVETVPLVSEPPCPKCGSRNAPSAEECRSCGVIFARLKTDTEITDLSLAGRRDLVELWEQVLTDYNNQGLHERFVRACYEAQSLAFAAHKYSRILSATPMEDISRSMQNRIIALASHRVDTVVARNPAQYRVPAFNNLILIAGGILLVMGLMLPGFKSLAGLGISAVMLGVGVRYFQRVSE